MNIDFDFQYKDPIQSEVLTVLASGFDEVAHDYDQDRELPAQIIRFLRQGKCIVEVLGQMLDLHDRLEIGVLQFRRSEYAEGCFHRVILDGSFQRQLSVHKLVIEEEGKVFASGIQFVTKTGLKMSLTAGSLPYSIAICIPGIAGRSLFDPEYYLDRYINVPVAQS